MRWGCSHEATSIAIYCIQLYSWEDSKEMILKWSAKDDGPACLYCVWVCRGKFVEEFLSFLLTEKRKYACCLSLTWIQRRPIHLVVLKEEKKKIRITERAQRTHCQRVYKWQLSKKKNLSPGRPTRLTLSERLLWTHPLNQSRLISTHFSFQGNKVISVGV